MNLEEITTRHNTVEAFATDPDLRERLRDQHMRGEAPQCAGSVAVDSVLATAVFTIPRHYTTKQCPLSMCCTGMMQQKAHLVLFRVSLLQHSTNLPPTCCRHA